MATRKLSLKKHTLRQLDRKELGEMVGGNLTFPPACPVTTWPVCHGQSWDTDWRCNPGTSDPQTCFTCEGPDCETELPTGETCTDMLPCYPANTTWTATCPPDC